MFAEMLRFGSTDAAEIWNTTEWLALKYEMSNWFTSTALASEQYATYSVYRRVPPCSIEATAVTGRTPIVVRHAQRKAKRGTFRFVKLTILELVFGLGFLEDGIGVVEDLLQPSIQLYSIPLSRLQGSGESSVLSSIGILSTDCERFETDSIL